MADKPRVAVIGAFVVAGLALAIVLVGLLGSGRRFERKYRYVCYFSGSINGLGIGSPVKYRGVEIGKVRDVRVRYAQLPEDSRIPVIVEVYGRRLQRLGAEHDPTEAEVAHFIGQGLRAQIVSESFITGQKYINLDLRPDSQAEWARTDGTGKYPEVPTLPSDAEALSASLNTMLKRLDQTDVEGLVRSITLAADAVPPALRSVSRLARDAGGTLDQATRALDALRSGGAAAQGILSPEGKLAVGLDRTLESVQRTAHSLRELADYLHRNPNALLVGKRR